MNMLKFPDDTFKNIVRPNVDTLYSSAWLNVSKEPIILSVPDTHDRYYLLEFMDAWTNVFASIGKRTTGTSAQNFAIVGPFFNGKLPKRMKIIKLPTNFAWILGRIQTNGKKDYKFVNDIQNKLRLTPLSRWPNDQNNNIDLSMMSLQKKSPEAEVIKLNAKKFYTIFAKALKLNPPANIDSDILKDLKRIGIEQGKDFDQEKVPQEIMNYLNVAMKKAINLINGKINSIGKIVNGWDIALDIGKYGKDYLKRAIVAKIGIGANLPEDAVYPTAFKDSLGNILNGKKNYVIHFDKDDLPPTTNAFWSITLYNQSSFLVPNSINRYALGDRDDIKFNDDGSLDIYIQNKPPEKNFTSNWLPAPTGNFNLTMRIYWPKKSVINGTWAPPKIKMNK
jgi:hypothetical protein